MAGVDDAVVAAADASAATTASRTPEDGDSPDDIGTTSADTTLFTEAGRRSERLRGDCRCEVWSTDVLTADRAPAAPVVRAEPAAIGPVVAVFGDSVTGAVGVDGASWVELLQQRRPDLDVRQEARMGLTIWSWPTNNMVDHIAEGGLGYEALAGVDTVIYMAGFNDLHHTDGDVDGAVAGLARVRDALESAPIGNFVLLPMLPVGEVWGARTDVDGPGGPVIEWIAEFNRRVVDDGIASPFDSGFDRDGDPAGYGDPEIYADYFNGDEKFIATGGVDGVHPGVLGHEVLAAQVDLLLRDIESVGVLNLGVGAGVGSTADAHAADG